ncbi:MAG: polyprenyl synthetase family protein [bacterium]|nr:polyprenyl synthetase family protein [bacterium]
MKLIEQVWKGLEQDLAGVEACMQRHLQSNAPLITEVGLHLLRGGGKRIRPLLLLLSAKGCGYEGDRHYLLASIVEYIHTASLLHDDVVDEAVVRRGQKSANRLWGNQASILVGDYLYSKALYLAVREENQEIMDVLSEATTIMSEGEVMQLSQIGNLDITEDDYLQVITNKTAMLIAAACKLGAIIAAADRSVKASLAAFGINIGIAFQLIDDALDYSAQEWKLGKEVGKDLQEGKVTLPLIHVLRNASGEETKRIGEIFQKETIDSDDLEYLFHSIDRHKAIDYTMDRTQGYVQDAKTALNGFPASSARDALLAVSDFIYNREL